MGLTKYIAALCCIVVLLVFLPVSDGWFESTTFNTNKNRVGSLFGEDVSLSGGGAGDWSPENSAFGDSQNPSITDKDGNPITPGEDPLSKLPAQGKYHAGITESAQKMNEEFLKLCQHYAAGSAAPNKQALVYYLMAASITEQGGITPDPAQVFVGEPWSVADYEADPDCIKFGGFDDHRGADNWYSKDIDPQWDSALGPMSVTNPALANKVYQAVTPYYDKMGTSIGTTPKREKSGIIGDKQNWYDSAQFTCGMVTYNWNVYSSNYDASLAKTNPYYFIGWTSMMSNIGESIAYKSNKPIKSFEESMTSNFAQEFTALCSEKWVIDEIREYVRKSKPLNYNVDTDIKTELYIPLIKKLRIEAVKRDPKFFSSSRYTSETPNHLMDPSKEGFLSWGMSKSTTALRTIICAVIIEERYSGAY